MRFIIKHLSNGNMPYGVSIVASDSTLLPILKSIISNIDTISVRVYENNENGRIIFSSATYEDIDGELINCNTIDEFKLLLRVKSSLK